MSKKINRSTANKAASLDQQLEEVRQAWRAAHPLSPDLVSMDDTWVMETFADHLVIEKGGKYFRVTYSRNEGGNIVFAPPVEWEEVERQTEWVAKSIQLQVLEAGRNPLKSLGANDDSLRVGNYLALWGDDDQRDLEFLRSGPNPDGSLGEFFTKNTDFSSSYTAAGVLYVDWEHGIGKALDKTGPDADEVLGVVDWKSAVLDEVGLWVERVLNRRNKYIQALESLIEAGLIGTSSEAIPGKTVALETGEITKWPLRRDTLTVMPAEPRMMTANVVTALKSLAHAAPAAEGQPEGAAAPAVKAKGRAVQPRTGGPSATQPKRSNPMNKKEILENFAKTMGLKVEELTSEQKALALRGTEFENDPPEVTLVSVETAKAMAKEAAETAVKAFAASAPAKGNPGNNVEVVEDEADKDFESDGQFFMAVKHAALNPANMDVRLLSRKAGLGLNESQPDAGGFLVRSQANNTIEQRMYEVGQILQRVDMETIGPNSNGMTWNRVDETSRANGSRMGGVQGYRVKEGGTLTASRPKFDQLELKLKKYAALCYATDEQLEDTVALESWLNNNVPTELVFMMEDDIYNGAPAGAGNKGIMGHPATQVVTRTNANAIIAADVLAMWARRWAGGGSQYVWLAEQDVHPQLAVMTIGDQPVYQPPGGLADSQYARLFGRPVIEVEYAAALGTTGDLMLVDLKQYKAIKKGDGVKVASSIHVQFLTDETAFRFIARSDGAPFWKSGLTPKSGASARSPYVVLSTSS